LMIPLGFHFSRLHGARCGLGYVRLPIPLGAPGGILNGKKRWCICLIFSTKTWCGGEVQGTPGTHPGLTSRHFEKAKARRKPRNLPTFAGRARWVFEAYQSNPVYRRLLPICGARFPGFAKFAKSWTRMRISGASSKYTKNLLKADDTGDRLTGLSRQGLGRKQQGLGGTS